MSSANISAESVAIVTGAAGDIGQAVSVELSSRGYRVLATDIKGERLLERVGDDDGLVPHVADLLDPATPAELWTRAAALGRPTGLVNAAGVLGLCSLLELRQSQWDHVLATNLSAPFFLMQHFGPRMPTGSAIVNVSSISATLCRTEILAAYNVSKAGLIAASLTFARALAPAVRVNAVCPGVIESKMNDDVVSAIVGRSPTDADLERRNAGIPLQRGGTASEVVRVIRFLLSEEASYMTGQAINISGGLVTW